MLTIICYDERVEKIWKQYELLFSAFFKRDKIFMCKWHKEGQSINEAIPELYDCVGTEREWRMIVVNHEMAESLKNPYEFFKEEVSIEKTEEIPLIRLTHMLSEVPEYYDMELVYQGDENDLGEEPDDIYYYGRKKHARCVRKDENASRKKSEYVLECESPQQIILMTSRAAQVQRGLRPVISSRTFENILSDFWSYNEYPKNVRFVVTDIKKQKGKLDERDLFLWMHGIMIMAVNELSSSSLEAYRLYRLNIDADTEEMNFFFSEMMERQKDLMAHLKKEKEEIRKASKEKEKEAKTIPEFKNEYPVSYPYADLSGLHINMEKYSYAKDIPELDEKVWKENTAGITRILERIQKEIFRALEQSLRKIRKTEEVTYAKPDGAYSKYQIEDVQSLADALETELFRTGIAENIDMQQTKTKLKSIDDKVKKYMYGRLSRRCIFGGLGIAVLVFLAGFFPMIWKSFGDTEAMLQILILIGTSCGVFLASGWIAVKFNQWKLKRLLRAYQEELDEVDRKLQDARIKTSDYITKAFNYRDAWHFLQLIQTRKEKKELKVLPEYQFFTMHENASYNVGKVCEKIFHIYSLNQKKTASRSYVEGVNKYRFNCIPTKTDYYEFPREEKALFEGQVNPLFCYISKFSLDKEENYE